MLNKLVSLLIGLIFCGNALSQPTPYYVPFAPGGMSDRTARLTATASSNYFVVNKPGANGQIAINEMNKTPGPIFLATPPFYVANKIIFKDALTYDPNNLETIAVLGETIGLLVCNKKSNVTTVKDIIDSEKGLKFGSAIRGGSEHLITEIFLEKTKNKNNIVAIYPAGGNKHVLDLLGGHIDCVFGNMATVLPFAQSDKLNLILTTHPTNLVSGVPTWKSQFGFEFELRQYNAIAVDRRWPTEYKNKILNDFKDFLTSKEFKKELESMGHTYNIILGTSADDVVQANNKKLMNYLLSNKNIKLVD